jgi:hypothetical protein
MYNVQEKVGRKSDNDRLSSHTSVAPTPTALADGDYSIIYNGDLEREREVRAESLPAGR